MCQRWIVDKDGWWAIPVSSIEHMFVSGSSIYIEHTVGGVKSTQFLHFGSTTQARDYIKLLALPFHIVPLEGD